MMTKGRKICSGVASRKSGVLTCVALLMNCLAAPSGLAQVVPLQQPEFTLMDPNSVDLQSANAYLHTTDVSIGAKANPLTHTLYSGPDGSWTTDYPSFWAVESEAQMDSFGFSFMQDRKSTRLNSSHYGLSRMPSSA